MHMCMCPYVCTRMCVHMCMCTRVPVFMCPLRACACVCTCSCVCVHMCVHSEETFGRVRSQLPPGALSQVAGSWLPVLPISGLCKLLVRGNVISASESLKSWNASVQFRQVRLSFMQSEEKGLSSLAFVCGLSWLLCCPGPADASHGGSALLTKPPVGLCIEGNGLAARPKVLFLGRVACSWAAAPGLGFMSQVISGPCCLWGSFWPHHLGKPVGVCSGCPSLWAGLPSPGLCWGLRRAWGGASRPAAY